MAKLGVNSGLLRSWSLVSVFNGTVGQGAYSENDQPAPRSVYGASEPARPTGAALRAGYRYGRLPDEGLPPGKFAPIKRKVRKRVWLDRAGLAAIDRKG